MEKVTTAVILAAGKSTRTYPLTLDTPKGLLKVLNKFVLRRTLDELVGIVNNVIIVVNYKQEMIRQAMGAKYNGIAIRYVVQKEPNGTGGALLACQPYLKGRFLVLNGDDLYSGTDIQRIMKYPYAILAQKVADPSRFGVLAIDSKGYLKRIIEKPKEKIGNLINAGCYLFDTNVFHHQLQRSSRGEYEIIDYLMYLAREKGVKVVEVKKYWLALGYSWDLLKINQYVLEHDFKDIQHRTKIPKGVTILGKVRIGKNVLFGSNVCIIGPAVIGDNVAIADDCRILPHTVIENNVTLDKECMIGESLLMDNTYLHRDAKRRGAIVTSKYTITLNT